MTLQEKLGQRLEDYDFSPTKKTGEYWIYENSDKVQIYVGRKGAVRIGRAGGLTRSLTRSLKKHLPNLEWLWKDIF